MGILVGVLWFACSATLFYLYHKLFDVIYFSLADGCFKEIVICGFLGAILTGLIISFWYISIPVVILLIIAIAKKKS